jgi:hypothetical protein
LAEAVVQLPKVQLGPSDLDRVSRGIPVSGDVQAEGNPVQVALLTTKGELAAVGEYDQAEKVIRPKLVMI